MDAIQQFKEHIGDRAEEIIANGLGLDRIGSKYKCPNVYAHKNGDKNPSMNYHKEAHQFYCLTCQEKIDIYGYYKEYLNYSHNDIVRDFTSNSDIEHLNIQKKRDELTTGLSQLKELTVKCIDYVKARGITADTMRSFKLRTFKNLIAFPYYKYNTIVGVKTRKPEKYDGQGEKMLSIPGSKPYLFNSQNVELKGELIVCEGEFDCMVIHQCGFSNVVSIGAGANSLSTLFEQTKEFFVKFDNIVVVSDNDSSGDNMDNLFLTQLGENVKLIDKNLYSKNDINEEYVLNGKDSVIKIINSARLKIEGVYDLDDMPYTGVDAHGRKYIPTGIESIDEALNDLGTGIVTVIAGRANGGKTTFCTQIKANAVDKGFKVFEVAGEGLKDIMMNRFYLSVIGRHKEHYFYKKINRKQIKEPKKHALDALQKWHKGKYKIFIKGESKLKSVAELFKIIEAEVKTNKHDLIIIDNLMSILSAKASEQYSEQASFVQQCCDLSKMYNVHIIIVAHPNKTLTKGQSMEFEQISGTADIGNKADNVISVTRLYDDNIEKEGCEGYIQVIKNRYYEDIPKVKVVFNRETETLCELKGKEELITALNWEKYLQKDVKINDGVENHEKYEQSKVGV